MKRICRTHVGVVLALSVCTACTSHGRVQAAAAGIGPADFVGTGDPQTILVLVAHPDDENMMGPALSRLARLGHKVRVIIATDGKYGTRVTDLPPDVLGPLRRKESECALEALGVPPAAFLAIDRLDTKNGVRSYLEGHKKLLSELRSELHRTRPDAIITFGPDGEYGHSEHIVAGATITELLLKDGLVEKYPLYFFAWTREQASDDDDLSYVHPDYVTHKLEHEAEDESRYVAAAKCFASQFTKAELEDIAQQVSSEHPRVSFFRRFYAPTFEAQQGAPVGRASLREARR